MLARIKNKLYIILNSILYRMKAYIGGAKISFAAELRIEQGGELKIGKNSKVTAGSIIHVAKNAVMVIGENTWIGPYNVIYCNLSVQIGSNTRISHFCTVTDNDYSISRNNINYINFDQKRKDEIVIGDNVWLCANSTILRGAKVENNTVVSPYTCLKRNN